MAEIIYDDLKMSHEDVLRLQREGHVLVCWKCNAPLIVMLLPEEIVLLNGEEVIRCPNGHEVFVHAD